MTRFGSIPLFRKTAKQQSNCKPVLGVVQEDNNITPTRTYPQAFSFLLTLPVRQKSNHSFSIVTGGRQLGGYLFVYTPPTKAPTNRYFAGAIRLTLSY
ncbi:hypothetical protein E2C01_022521 [Portunus trituberculatus]|uniref:Uncharacterized protein n=1 Tax=Portunus trituberculatus TaxID=210409 RepID=A0A5B7E847_PORTR|nr:hypothetical protein [Portunus trituberculatus]